MLDCRKPLIIIALFAFLASGCMESVSRVWKGKGSGSRSSGGRSSKERIPMQPERDVVDPQRKPGMGMEYDPRAWIADKHHPHALPKMITSPGFKGMTQQTFAQTGGDFNVHLNVAGDKMIYNSTRYAHNPEVCIQGITAKSVQLVTEDKMSDMMPKFSPNGQEVAWCSNRYGNYDILVQDAEARPDSRPRQLTRSTDDDIHPTWSPAEALTGKEGAMASRLIAFSRFNSMDGVWQIWVMNYHTRTLSYVTEGLFPEFRPMVRKQDGRVVYTLAYQRARKRDVPWYSLWTIDLRMGDRGAVEAVGSPQEIIANDQWAAINPAWSPDGNYLAFATVRKSVITQWQARLYKADDIWVVRLDGTDLTQITRHSAPDWDPWWAKDPGDPKGPGRIYFCSERMGVANIWSVKPIIPGMLARKVE